MPADADSSRNPANAVPTHKHDLLGAEIIVASGYPAVHAQLPALLVWMQDINWPVARVLAPFLASIGAPLADHVRTILASDDPIWTYNVLAYLVSASAPLALAMEPQLTRLAAQPSQAERDEGVDELAGQILATLHASR